MGINGEWMIRHPEGTTPDLEAIRHAVSNGDDVGAIVSLDWSGTTVTVWTLQRYYSPHYPKGHWPWIRAAGERLVGLVGPDVEVRYGGDHVDGWEMSVPWTEVVEENDRHWEVAGGPA